MQTETALAAYQLQLEADGRSKHTIAQAARHVRALARWAACEGLGGDVEALGHADLARFLVSPQARTRPDGEPKKATSVNALRSSLRCFFGYLHAAGEIPVNPGRLIRRARTGDPPPRAMREADAARFVAALDQARTGVERRDRVLFRLMLGTGIRLASALGLRREDVDLGAGEMRIVVKGDREVVVRLDRDARDLLSGWSESGRTGFVFHGDRDGRPLTSRHVQRRLRGWLERAGVERRYSPHSLRHTFATRLYARTGDILAVRRALGHRSIASTAVYAGGNVSSG